MPSVSMDYITGAVAYLPALLVDAVIFLLLFAILMVRPDGLFAQSTMESPTKRV